MKNLTVVLCISMLMPMSLFSQNLEVEGKAKITVMDDDITTDSLVMLRPGGELARRHVSSLPDSTGGWTEVVDTTSTMKRVGIGTTTPSEKLEVNGNVKVSGIISGVSDPVNAQDAATKAYVDNNALPSSPSTGEIVYYNGTSWILLSPGTDGQILQLNSGIPSWTDSSCDLYIGQFYKGGYIFYLDATGCHGLVAAPVDQSAGAEWGCIGTSIGGTSAAVGTGQANTTAIVNGCPTAGLAARLCDDLVYGGYDDWFLPSKDELNLMWENLADSDGNNSNSGPSDPNNIGGFEVTFYWSSSEFSVFFAWRQYFVDGDQVINSKDYVTRVRAIRAF